MNNYKPLKEQVKDNFPFLVKSRSGFRLSKQEQESPYAEMIFTSANMKLWFYEERAQYYFKVASAVNKEWINFKDLRTLITGREYETGLLSEDDAVFFKNNLKEIEQLLSKKNISNTLNQIDVMLTKRAYDRWGPTLEDLEKTKNEEKSS
jgi:hypothetical protein